MNKISSQCYCRNCSYSETPNGLLNAQKYQNNNYNKFVKVRIENGFRKTNIDCPSLSRCTSSTSRCTSNVPNLFTKIPNASYDYNKTQQIGLTDNRQWYEKSKNEIMKQQKNNINSRVVDSFLFYPNLTNNFEYFLSTLTSKRMAELNDFRLKNSEKCFSALSKYSINKRMGTYDGPKEEHVCEFAYKLNERGLLTPANKSIDGKGLICKICNKIDKYIPINNNIAPTINKSQHKIIIQIDGNENSSKIKPESKCRGKGPKLIPPANSSALIYQKFI